MLPLNEGGCDVWKILYTILLGQYKYKTKNADFAFGISSINSILFLCHLDYLFVIPAQAGIQIIFTP